MKSVYQYNDLNNKTVSRKEIVALLELAKKEEQILIIQKLERLLNNNSDDQFKITISEEIKETVPASFIRCFDCFDESDQIHYQGLGKAVTPSDVYDMITNKMIELIRVANANENSKKWEGKVYGTGYLIPFNFVSKKRYRGVNVLMLTELEPLENPFFMTFKQVEEKGGRVKKGAKGREVIYFVELYKTEDKQRNLSLSSYDREKVKSFAKENDIKGGLTVIPMLKYYNVFNGNDIEGIDFDLENFKVGYVDIPKPADDQNKMPIAEAIIQNYPSPQPKINFGGDEAYYTFDRIQMPYLSDFETVNDYYRVLFHELSHSTGHPKRLARKFGTKFGSKDYAFEELVAEFGATFLSAEAGIVWHNPSNHAAYLKNWNAALTHIKDDNKFIMRASTEAQKVADFVLQFDDKGNPLYFKDLIDTPVQPKKEKVSKSKPKVSKEQEKVSNKKEGEQLELELRKPKIDQVQPLLERLGFVKATEAKKYIKKDENLNVFIFKSELGKFLQKMQFYKFLILIKGGPHSSKTQLAMQIADLFAENNFPVAVIDKEQGGVRCKDTQETIDRNVKESNKKLIDITGDLENPMSDLKEICKYYKVIVADSVQDLKLSAVQLNELRENNTDVIWVFISQVKDDGNMYGGNKMDHNPTVLIDCHPNKNPELRYATLEKNRSNDISLMYSIYHKKLIKTIPVEKVKKVKE